MSDVARAEERLTRVLYVAWLAPAGPRWYTIGRLTTSNDGYAFEYTRGFEDACAEAGMRPIYEFPDPHAIYRSRELFPLFTNRLMRPSRPDYPELIDQLDLGAGSDEIDILARLEGYRATDYFRVYLRPTPVDTQSGALYRLVCFSTGLRFRSEADRLRAGRLLADEPLRLVPEPDNPFDHHAHRIESLDGHHVGYVPRYHAPDLTRLGRLGTSLEIAVQRNNADQAPWQRRLLCRIEAPWPVGFVPLDSAEHQTLGPAITATEAVGDE